jgi:ATP-dependent DNA helicase PIF1
MCYASVDTVTEIDQVTQYPTEFLNSLDPPGLPPHKLKVKLGCPVMLLRNLNAPKLCNGTRLIVKQLLPHIIKATILTGQGKGENVFIPRIPLIPSDCPFPFKRLQFPIRPCFVMTINKAQGQSLSVVGLNLDDPCFSHGQLYVGCSRVGQRDKLFICSPNQKTKNIVYPTVLH